MPKLTIEGGHVLNGTVKASGAKNAALPILAASILFDGETVLENVPQLNDIDMMIKMLNSLGILAVVTHSGTGVRMAPHKKIRHIAPYELVTAMRASFFVAGPILAKTGFAKVPLPGGCSIGARPIDIHLKGFKAMGANVSIEHGFVQLEAKKLKGERIYLDFPSVGATENIMMAATLAEGETYIENAAREPEIIDLAECLIKAGAKIDGHGTSTIHITGVSSLKGIEYSIMPDRVEAGTLLIAGAITKGTVTVIDAIAKDMEPLIQKLRECGVEVKVGDRQVTVSPNGPLKRVNIETLPHPGFPTDMQAQMMSLLCISEGSGIVTETIFENRFMHAQELRRMGANIKIEGPHAIITGETTLSGAEVKITDLRAGAALILAGLVAEGTTTVHGLKHLTRGYEDLPKKLQSLGAVFIP